MEQFRGADVWAARQFQGVLLPGHRQEYISNSWVSGEYLKKIAETKILLTSHSISGDYWWSVWRWCWTAVADEGNPLQTDQEPVRFSPVHSTSELTINPAIIRWVTQFHFQESGVYAACFSNEFSTFSHKLIYMDFSLSDESNPLPGVDEHATVLTQMELTAQEIHKSLNAILDYQVTTETETTSTGYLNLNFSDPSPTTRGPGP